MKEWNSCKPAETSMCNPDYKCLGCPKAVTHECCAGEWVVKQMEDAMERADNFTQHVRELYNEKV